ncbi:DUF4132 domain-containing protein [Catenuloplanes japonicus]|uniref:DUF4132 domain-containing protein n=1 Tax=Catenuloplanes japonicus TaxID=33876 RepID=UPI000524AEC7|nr:DUF4132 domain-containing protein [Catenuloplanes japonicus]
MISWDAPPPSIVPAPWTPPSQADVWKDGVLVDRWLRDVVPPRRGGIDTGVRPAATLDEAWAGLRDHVWAAKGDEIWHLATSTDVVERAMGERLLDPRARPGEPGEDQELVWAFHRRLCGAGHAGFEWLVDYLAASSGLPEAARMIIDAYDCDLPTVFGALTGRLRELLAVADDATYARARDAILAGRDDRLVQDGNRHRGRLEGDTIARFHWSITYLLPLGPRSGPEERAAHDAALHRLDTNDMWRTRLLGLACGDAETLERILAVDPGADVFGTVGGRLLLAGLLDSGNATAVCRLRPSSLSLRNGAHESAVWTSLLAHIDHDDAREILAELHDEGYPEAGARTTPVVPAWRLPSVASGTPFAYQPPEPVRPVPRDTEVTVAPVLDLPGSAPALMDVHDQYQSWNGIGLRDCDDAQVTAWLEHHEHWAIPSTFTALALAPRWTHERLMALGFTHDHRDTGARAMASLLARYGVSHVPVLLAAFAHKDTVEPALAAAQPVGHVALAAPVARAFTARAHRRAARAWLLHHPRHAAAGLVAEWRAKPADPAIRRALRWLDTQGHRALIESVTGKTATDVIAMLDQDPLAAPKAKRPKIPDYLTATPLPPLDPPAAQEDQELLLVRLAASEPDAVHPGLAEARETWTAASRATFAAALVDRWLEAGMPGAGVWTMYAVALIGDDAGLRRLATLARRWAGPSVRVRDRAALDALRLRGTDAALIALAGLAEKSRFPEFEAVVRDHIDEIAQLRGLTADELADRLVPRFGLDDGGDVLATDAGTFRIVFDHELMPVVRDTSGRVLADLPAPARGEDRKRHQAAKDRLAEVRTEAKASAALHLARLENAMCDERRIPAAAFLDRFAGHPWMTHLARRLVWGVFLGETLTATVRVAEDGSLATVADETFVLPEAASVAPLHPAAFPDGELGAWRTVLDDYDLMQPFPQLDRPVHRRSGTALDGYAGRTVSFSALRGLERQGWDRSHDEPDVVQLTKPLTGGELLLEVAPGWYHYDRAASVPDQTIVRLTLDGDPSPAAFSEAVHDLRLL